jgi:26S proteasome regulatory subunit N8
MASSTTMTMDIDEDEPVVETPLLGNIDEVTMHPLVLLSAADHYHRVARGTRKRVVGVLLGSVSKGVVDCTNSFAVPFEEDSKNAVSSSCSSPLGLDLGLCEKTRSKLSSSNFYYFDFQSRLSSLYKTFNNILK